MLEAIDLIQDREKPLAKVGQFVFDARWQFGVTMLLDELKPYQLNKPLVENLGREPFGRAFQLPWTIHPLPNLRENMQRPLAADTLLEDFGHR